MIRRTMTAWFVATVPVMIMFFALAMERVESRLRHLTVQENEVEEFLQAARPEEVRVLFGSGIGGALELFQRRRLPDTGPHNGHNATVTHNATATHNATVTHNGAASHNGTAPSNGGLRTLRPDRQRP